MSSKERLDREAADATERRFNETVRNLLNTPPKPHGKEPKRHKQDEAPRSRRAPKKAEGR